MSGRIRVSVCVWIRVSEWEDMSKCVGGVLVVLVKWSSSM